MRMKEVSNTYAWCTETEMWTTVYHLGIININYYNYNYD